MVSHIVSSFFVLGLSGLSLTIWIFLVVFWGRFWWADQFLTEKMDLKSSVTESAKQYPTICAIIPARNEADILPISLKSLLLQVYPGQLSIILVDDQSTDGTGEVARQVAQTLQQTDRLTVLSGATLPPGWTGKLWAMEQGVRHTQKGSEQPDYFLFTDADIKHSQTNLHQLATKAETDQLDLTSLMVLLRCDSFWEKLLIPAFVFFFQLLYPFPWVNDPTKKTAAAAGGCILIRRQALTRIGGLQILQNALIDDCSLAAAVKRSPSSPSASAPRSLSSPKGSPTPHPIWLGLTTTTLSLRPYPTLNNIWDMVTRTAYTQLHYSPLRLVGTVFGMILVYLLPPLGLGWSLLNGQTILALATCLTWLLMSLAYWPTLKLYQGSPLLAFCLPFIALLYLLMTIDSARHHWQGQGSAWKGRFYGPTTLLEDQTR